MYLISRSYTFLEDGHGLVGYLITYPKHVGLGLCLLANRQGSQFISRARALEALRMWRRYTRASGSFTLERWEKRRRARRQRA